MKKTKLVFLLGIVFGIFVGLLFVTPVFTVGDIELENPLQTTDLKVILGGVIGKILALVGSITLLVFIAGGFLWLTSAGNAEKVQVGTKTMLYAIIGLFIIFASYAIINTVIGGLTGEKVTDETTVVDKKDDKCKDYNQDWLCLSIEKCDGITTPIDDGKYKEACTAAASTCINDKCPGNNTPNIKCCLPKAGVTTGVATAEIVSKRDVECKKEHPTWSCMDVDECNLNLTGKKTTTQKRTVCTATKASCTTGKCNVGADADNLKIVCCEGKPVVNAKTCSTDNDCESGWYCSTTNICVKKCTADSECGGSLKCKNGICGICKQNTDCGRGFVCSSKATCVECEQGDQCNSGECTNNACISKCGQAGPLKLRKYCEIKQAADPDCIQDNQIWIYNPANYEKLEKFCNDNSTSQETCGVEFLTKDICTWKMGPYISS